MPILNIFTPRYSLNFLAENRTIKTMFLSFRLHALLFDFGLNKKKNVLGELQDHKAFRVFHRQTLFRYEKQNGLIEWKWSDYFNLESSSKGSYFIQFKLYFKWPWEMKNTKRWQRDYNYFSELYFQSKYIVVTIGLLSTPQDKFFDSQLLIR